MGNKTAKRALSLFLMLALLLCLAPWALAEEPETEAEAPPEASEPAEAAGGEIAPEEPEEAEPAEVEEETAREPDAAQDEEIQALEPVEFLFISPEYAGIITEDMLRGQSAAARPRRAMAAAAAVSYQDESGVALSMRSALQARQVNFTGYLKTTSQLTSDTLSAMYYAAVAHTGEPTAGDYLRFQTGGYSASASGYTSGGSYYYTIQLTFTYYSDAAQEQELDAAVAALLAELGVDGKTDYEKIAAVYRYLCANIRYDYTHYQDSSYLLQFTAYAALINKTAVCQGYSNLLYRLLLELGVDTRIVSSAAMNHAWSLVELGGRYFYLDSTWDAGRSSFRYFLRGTDTWPGTGHDSGDNIEGYLALIPSYDFVLADVNGDGGIDVRDIHALRQYAGGQAALDSCQLAAGDVYADFQVNVLDVNLLRRYVAGLLAALPRGA